MIQFNLLPDVKLQYLKAERTKRLVTSVSVIAGAVALGVFVLLFISVNVVQKKNISDLNSDITSNTNSIRNTPNVNKILTIQSQLTSLTSLHDQKPAASRVFTYIGQVTPSTVSVSSISVDFTAHTITLVGNAPSLDSVNTLVDTLKYTSYTSDKNTTASKAFSNVVLSSFSRNKSTAAYTVMMSYDTPIFDTTYKVNLSVGQANAGQSNANSSLFKQNGSDQ